MNNSIRIRCVGFSVTCFGEPPYPIKISEQLLSNSINATITYSAAGGLSIDSMPYFLRMALKSGEADIVVLEIATSWYSLIESDLENAVINLKKIIDYLESLKVKIIFLNLFRRDIKDDDIVTNAISIVNNGKYPIIDLKKRYRNQLDCSGNDGTIDGVHPTSETILEISNTVVEFIKNNVESLKSFENLKCIADKYDLVTFPNNSSDFIFNNSNIGFPIRATKLEIEETMSLDFDKEVRIIGIFFLYGPDTHYLNITINTYNLEIPMRDEMSFYRRIGYRQIGNVGLTKKIEIFHPNKNMNIELKREPWEKISKNLIYVVGFTIE
jgi:hypothetical protein